MKRGLHSETSWLHRRVGSLYQLLIGIGVQAGNRVAPITPDIDGAASPAFITCDSAGGSHQRIKASGAIATDPAEPGN